MRKTLLTAFSLLSVVSYAQTVIDLNDISYKQTSASTVEVSEYHGKAKEVSIPETIQHGGKQFKVTAIGEQAFYWKDVTSINLPSSIDSVKYRAFASSQLNEIKLPEGLKYIGSFAFNSSKITELTTPSTLKKIDNSAFFTCRMLKNIVFKEGLEEIEEAAFYKNESLVSVTFPKSLKTIGKTSFCNCAKLSSVSFPEGLVSIGAGAFNGCAALTNVVLPNTLTSIGKEAFLKCRSMTTFNLPKNLEVLGTSFISMTSVNSFTVDPDNKQFHVVDGVLYNTKNTLLYAIPMKGMKELSVQKNCIGIWGGACWGSDLEKVILPEGLLAIDGYAFESTNISDVQFPNSLTLIGEQAFADTKLTKVVLPENFMFLEDGTFAQCKELTSVTIPSAVATIYNHAFARCKKLTEIICLGSTPPTLASYSESTDHPFWEIGESPKLLVPKGTANAYKLTGDYEDMNIVEQENGILKLVSTSPKNKSTIKGNEPLSFTYTFAEPVKVINEKPDVTLREKGLLYRNIFTPDDCWKVTLSQDKKSITVWAADFDGYTTSYHFDADKTYFVVLPANTVESATGDKNERIVISLIGSNAAGIDLPSPTETSQREVARYNLSGQQLHAPQKGINIIKYADGTTRKIVVR